MPGLFDQARRALTEKLTGKKRIGNSEVDLKRIKEPLYRAEIAYRLMVLPMAEAALTGDYTQYPFSELKDVLGEVQETKTGHVIQYSVAAMIAAALQETRKSDSGLSRLHVGTLDHHEEAATIFKQFNKAGAKEDSLVGLVRQPLYTGDSEDTFVGERLKLVINHNSPAIDILLSSKSIDYDQAINIAYTLGIAGLQLIEADTNDVQLVNFAQMQELNNAFPDA